MKALSLEGLAKAGVQNVGKDFNLTKIKKISAELKKRDDKSKKVLRLVEKPFSTEEDIDETSSHSIFSLPDTSEAEEFDNAEKIETEETSIDLTAEVGDELLADLLDKDLLKGRKEQKKEEKP